MKKIHFSLYQAYDLKFLFEEISEFEYMEEVEIFYRHDFCIFDYLPRNFIPKTTRSVKKIVILSDSSQVLSFVKSFVPENISYEIQFYRCPKYFS